MRRNDRAVTDTSRIRQILDGCKTCRLAMVDCGRPYVVPLSFGYTLIDETLTLYFHSAAAGRKIRILRANNDVCFEISSEGSTFFDETAPCTSGMFFSSVIGFGTALFVEDADEKCAALALLMKRQTGAEIAFTAKQAGEVCVIKVVSNDFTGKMKLQSQ